MAIKLTSLPLPASLRMVTGWSLTVAIALLMSACGIMPPAEHFQSSKPPIEFTDYVPMEQGVLQRISLYFGYEVETSQNSKPILIIYRLNLANSEKEPLATINVDGIVVNDYARKSVFAVSWDEKRLLYMHDQSSAGPEALRSKAPGLYEYVAGQGERLIHPQARVISHSTFKLPRNAIEFALGDPNEPTTEHYVHTTEGVEFIQEELFIMQFGGTELHRAAARGSVAKVQKLLDERVDLEAMDNRGFTPLHVAIWNSQEEVAKRLIKGGADVNRHIRGPLDWSPLEEAARFGLVETITLLLDKGAELKSSTRSGVTALHIAIDYKKLNVAEVLITRGADVNAKAKDGSTPLHLFAQGGRDERTSWRGSQDEAVLKLLLSKGADVSARNDDFITPLHYAVLKNNLMTAQMLIENGANADTMELPDRHYYGRELHHEGSVMMLRQRIQETLNSAWWRGGTAD